jgi:hypothetical protein
MKKRACQTSIDTHPVHTAEANAERAEIIATLYTVQACASTAILADSSRVKASLLGIEDLFIVQVGDSVASKRSSEEDVYYRIDSICEEEDWLARGKEELGNEKRQRFRQKSCWSGLKV